MKNLFRSFFIIAFIHYSIEFDGFDYEESRPIVIDKIKEITGNQIEVLEDNSQIYKVLYKSGDDQSIITFDSTESPLIKGKKLGRLQVEGAHKQSIIKVFYYFNEKEMEFQW